MKTATDSTLAPLFFGVGQGIFEDTLQELHEFANYVVCEQTTTYFSLATATEFANDPSANFISIRFRDDATPWTLYQGELLIDPDVFEIEFGATCTTHLGNSVEVELTIGSASITLSGFTGAAQLSLSDTVLTSATGTGRLAYSVVLTHTVGGSPVCTLDRMYCESRRIVATDLPDPTVP